MATPRGRFFSGPSGIVYLTRTGHFYVLDLDGPRELSDPEADKLVQEEILTDLPFAVHACAVAAERMAMIRPLHPDLELDTCDRLASANRASLEVERRRRELN